MLNLARAALVACRGLSPTVPVSTVLRMTLLVSTVCAVTPPPLHAWLGSTPTLDGILRPEEWSDAFVIPNINAFDAAFLPVTPPAPGQPTDLDAVIFIKHDSEYLYVAMNVTDNFVYGLQDDNWWTPPGNPAANNLTQQGWPWFGDENEVLLSGATPAWPADNATVNGSTISWQMVCNSGKSRLGGVGVGGLLEGEPRSSNYAWHNYQAWILSGAMRCATSYHPGAAAYGGSVLSREWAVAFSLIQLPSGQSYSAGMPATPVGFQIAIGDVDTPADGNATIFGIRHEMWLSGSHASGSGPGSGNNHTDISSFATLILEPGPMPPQ